MTCLHPFKYVKAIRYVMEKRPAIIPGVEGSDGPDEVTLHCSQCGWEATYRMKGLP